MVTSSSMHTAELRPGATHLQRCTAPQPIWPTPLAMLMVTVCNPDNLRYSSILRPIETLVHIVLVYVSICAYQSIHAHVTFHLTQS